jgi:hypothetical protein
MSSRFEWWNEFLIGWIHVDLEFPNTISSLPSGSERRIFPEVERRNKSGPQA